MILYIYIYMRNYISSTFQENSKKRESSFKRISIISILYIKKIGNNKSIPSCVTNWINLWIVGTITKFSGQKWDTEGNQGFLHVFSTFLCLFKTQKRIIHVKNSGCSLSYKPAQYKKKLTIFNLWRSIIVHY